MCVLIPARIASAALVATWLVVFPSPAGANRARLADGALSLESNAGTANNTFQAASGWHDGDLYFGANFSEGLGGAAQVTEPKNDHHFFSHILAALGGGTGVRVGGLRHTDLDRELVRRMRIQDKAVALAIVAMYFLLLLFTASIKYHDAHNDSPVTYYADPRYHSLVTEGEDAANFLDAFNQAPKNAHLQVTGYLPVPEGQGNVQWRGDHYRVAFTFALDLSPWVVREPDGAAGPRPPSADSRLPGLPAQPLLQDGISLDDHSVLETFLATNKNDLAIVEVEKDVVWPDSEELATNIKHRIRQMGFQGIIGINLSESEKVSVFKNAPWANFMHSHTVKILVILSMCGWAFYFPYMWLRCSTTKIRSRYKVDLPITSYWPLIEHKLTANGFEGP